MSKTYRCELEVRGYEIDGFGHVNHAVYLNYLEVARWKMLSEVGIGLESFRKWKRWPVIAGVEIKYLKPTFMGNRLTVETSLVEPGRSTVYFVQKIFRGTDLVAEAKIRSVTVDEGGRPVESPAELRKLAE